MMQKTQKDINITIDSPGHPGTHYELNKAN